KPLGKEDRERLWANFSSACERAKSEQEQFRSKSRRWADSIVAEVDRARPDDFCLSTQGLRDTLIALGKHLRQAGQALSKHKHEMFGEHKQECFERIQDVRAAQDAWWELLTQHRSGSFEDRQDRIRANLEQNYERHRKAAAALESCRANADKLRDQIASAWNE